LAPDETETSQSQQEKFPVADVFSHIEVADGRIWLRPDGVGAFAGDLPEAEQRVVWATEAVPAPDLFNQKLDGVAWRSKPSWYVVATQDRPVHPDLERFVAKRVGATTPPILPPQDGYLFLYRSKFAAAFAADVNPAQAAFMAASQVPWGVAALQGQVTTPAWKSRPSWYLVTADDRMIPPPAQRQMAARAGATVVATPGSHAVYVSNPQVAALGAAK
jgi:hypothetical protein